MYSTAFLDIPPLVSAGGCVTLPGSKSISNRVLLLAALSQGTTTLHDLLDSDDTRVMLDALRALGCQVQPTGSSDKKGLQVTGLGGRFNDTVLRQTSAENPLALFLGNAGTAMRPLTAALALLGGHFQMSGVARMHERPIGDLVDALRQLGCHIDYTGQDGYPPLRIAPARFKNSGPISVRGDVSSQFLTALLMALPLVAEQDIVIEVVGELISKPYIDITLKLLARFGIQVQRDGWQRFTIPAGSQYQSPGEIYVEADASSASYFIALGAIAGAPTDLPGGGPLRIEGVGLASIQGDIRFVEAAQAMGAVITGGPNWLEVSRAKHQNAQGEWALKAIDLDCNHIPDAAMTLAVMALYADGPSTLRNIASWRVKETDRIAAMAAELRKMGGRVVEGPDFIEVSPPASPADWLPGVIHTYDDHRMAMCLSLAAFNPLATTEDAPGATDYNAAGVKNYPSLAAGFAATLATLTNGRYPQLVGVLADPAGGSATTYCESPNLDVWGTGNCMAELAEIRGGDPNGYLTHTIAGSGGSAPAPPPGPTPAPVPTIPTQGGTCTVNVSILKQGDGGEGLAGWSVKALQLVLRGWDPTLEVDGSFGPLTEAAVRNFQASAHIAVDGIVGPTTWSFLLNGHA